MPLKLLSLNIEGDNHYDLIFPFFAQENPDVLCVQEFFLDDLSLFEQKLGMKGYVVGMWTCTRDNTARISKRGLMGVAIFSKLPFKNTSHAWYTESGHQILELFDPAIGPEKVSRALLWADIEKDGKVYRVATTHFTWSAEGSVTQTQERDLQKLLQITDTLGPLILCGDFNAPRGKAIFDTLAQKYTDNIPPEVTTTMDNALHRNHDLAPFVVDVLFTSKEYGVQSARVVSGVSDHCGVVGTIQKEE